MIELIHKITWYAGNSEALARPREATQAVLTALVFGITRD